MDPIFSFFPLIFVPISLLSFFVFKKFVFKSETKTSKQLIYKIFLILLVEFLIFVLGMIGITFLIASEGLGGGLLAALIVPNLFISCFIISLGASILLMDKKFSLRRKLKRNKKQILIKGIVAAVSLIILSIAIYFLQLKIEQLSYENRAKQADGKLYSQTEPIGLVQQVINNPTHESNNIVINITQYFYRSYMVFTPWNNMSQLYCCELLDRIKTPPYFAWDEEEGARHSYEVIEQDSHHQIISVKSSFPNTNFVAESYFTIVKTNDGWRVDKYRYLASAGELYLYGFNKTDKQPVLTDSNTGVTYQSSQKSSKLALEDDQKLITYFNKNKERFYQLLQFVKASKEDSLNWNQDPLVHKSMQDLYLTAVIQNYNRYCPTCIFFIIAGDNNDTVGYFYQPDVAKLPKIDGQSLIIIRKIGNGWYFYKGT